MLASAGWANRNLNYNSMWEKLQKYKGYICIQIKLQMFHMDMQLKTILR